ncbi:MAG: FAD binding domain-containing protein [Acidimicrobiales bacterium]
MKPGRFEYHAPESLDEALELLAEYGDEAKVLAGGQSLVPLLSMRLARPSHVIDINGVPGLDAIQDRGDDIVMGAAVRERVAERSALVNDKLPILADALPLIGHVAIRNRGTIGGSLAHADASAELPAVAVLTDAQMVVRSIRGERVVASQDFFDGHFTTTMSDDECLVEVRVPAGRPDAGWSCAEVARRHGDFALVGAAAMVALSDDGRIDEARVSLFGVADRAIRVEKTEASLRDAAPAAATWAAAAEEAASAVEPPSDLHGSSEFRRKLTAVVVRRALATAAAHAAAPREERK